MSSFPRIVFSIIIVMFVAITGSVVVLHDNKTSDDSDTNEITVPGENPFPEVGDIPSLESAPGITFSQAAIHKVRTDCWLIISGKVYDVTSYLSQHPGGSAIVVPYCGADATTAFKNRGRTGGPDHSAYAYSLLPIYYVADLVSNVASNVSPSTNTLTDTITPLIQIDIVPPSVPAGLSATLVSPNQIKLSWNASTDGTQVTGYRIYRDGVLLGTSNTNSYTHTGLSTGATYSYTVSAYDSSGNTSIRSTAVSKTTTGTLVPPIQLPPTPPPTQIPPPTSSGLTSSQVATHNTQSNCWIIISSKVYNVTPYLSQHPGGSAIVIPTCGTDATAAFKNRGRSGGPDHSAYAYSLLPTYFVSNLSTTASLTYNLIVSRAGTGVGTVTSLRGSISCGSTCSVTGLSSGTSVTLSATPATGSTFTGWSGGGCSGTGSCVTSVTSNVIVTATFSPSAGDTTAPSIPSSLSATAISSSQINLSWNASSDNVGVTGYKVYRDGVLLTTVTGTSYNNTGLTASTDYLYAVAATDAVGNSSAQSSSVTRSTLALVDNTPPSVPSGLSATAVSASQINLSWNASSDNVGVIGYKVYRGGVQVGSASTNSYSDTGLSAGMAYSYTVSASDAAGNNSAQSGSDSATTQAANSGYSLSQVATHNTQSNCWIIISGKVYNVTSFIFIHPGGSAPMIPRCGLDATTAFNVDGSDGGDGYNHSAYARSLLPTYYVGNLLTAPATYSLTVTKTGTGSGTVTSSLGSISCGSTCSVTGLSSGTSVTLSATPATGSTFTGWSGGGCSGTGSCVTSVTSNVIVTATFSPSAGDTTAPSIPSSLSATAISSSQINLSWSASTDNVGVTGYKIYRDGVEITTTAGTSYSNTGLTPNTSYSYTISSSDIAGNSSAQSASVTRVTLAMVDTTPPSTPTNLSATAISSSQINLTWSASTDNVGVTGYKIYRGGVQVGSSATNSYSDTGLSANTSYSYTVSSGDANGNNSTQSNSASATTQSSNSSYTISQVATHNTQSNCWIIISSKVYNVTSFIPIHPGGASSIVSRCGRDATTAFNVDGGDGGDGYNHSAYARSLLPTYYVGDLSIVPTTYNLTVTKAGTGTGTVTSSLGSISCGNTCTLTGLSAGTSVTLTATPATGSTFTGWSGGGCSGTGSCVTSVTTNVTITATFSLSTGDTSAPSIPTGLSATAISSSQINLSWSASTDNVGVTGYNILRSTISGKSYTKIGTVTGMMTGFFDNGLSAQTTYYYVIEAYDAAGNKSKKSSQASATTMAGQGTPDTTPPSTPTNLSATAISSSQINLSWTASSDNVGVTGYTVMRATASGGPYTQVGTTNTTSFSNTGLSAQTTYYYVVKASDAAGNTSGNSTQASVTTLITPDTTPPSTPTNLSATAISSSQINLSWTASTDNVGVTGYKIYRGGVQIATTAGTSYSNTGLSANTSYTYTVSAYDAAGNNSAQSVSVTRLTLVATDTTPPSTPTNLSATAISSSQINLSWTASSDNVGVTGYRIYRGGTLITTTSGTGTTYSNTGLNASTAYSYAVSAIDTAGNASSQSTSASATTPAAGNSYTLAQIGTHNSLTNCWIIVSNKVYNVTAYIYPVDLHPGTLDVILPYCGTNATNAYVTKDKTKLTPHNISTDAILSSFYVGTITGHAYDTLAPTAPTNLSATAISSSRIDLSWNASSDNVAVTGYYILRSTVSGSGYKRVGTSFNTSYSNTTSVASATTYYYVVQAFDADGNLSTNSSQVQVTTP